MPRLDTRLCPPDSGRPTATVSPARDGAPFVSRNTRPRSRRAGPPRPIAIAGAKASEASRRVKSLDERISGLSGRHGDTECDEEAASRSEEESDREESKRRRPRSRLTWRRCRYCREKRSRRQVTTHRGLTAAIKASVRTGVSGRFRASPSARPAPSSPSRPNVLACL